LEDLGPVNPTPNQLEMDKLEPETPC